MSSIYADQRLKKFKHTANSDFKRNYVVYVCEIIFEHKMESFFSFNVNSVELLFYFLMHIGFFQHGDCIGATKGGEFIELPKKKTFCDI